MHCAEPCRAALRCVALRAPALRPDRYMLEVGDSSLAAVAKYNLEEMQRAERRVGGGGRVVRPLPPSLSPSLPGTAGPAGPSRRLPEACPED